MLRIARATHPAQYQAARERCSIRRLTEEGEHHGQHDGQHDGELDAQVAVAPSLDEALGMRSSAGATRAMDANKEKDAEGQAAAGEKKEECRIS